MATEGVWLPRRWSSSRCPARATQPPAPAARGGRPPPVLEVAGLAYAYPDRPPVLRDLDLTVGAGEQVAIVGANGSGKSTLARLLVGLTRPQAGTVRIAGLDPAGQAATARAVLAGLAFQDPELGFLATTVDDEVRLGLPHDPETEMSIAALMPSLGLPLERFGRRSPYRLSGGEQRRLSLAPALLRGPRLLVLDEPTFAQDRTGVTTLIELLRARAATGMAVVAISHDERFVSAFATRVLELRDGRLYERGLR